MTQGLPPLAAPQGVAAQEQRQPHRHGPDFGGAITHREVVQEKLRVDPAAVAERMQATPPARVETPRQASRQQRLAEDDAAYEQRRANNEPGSRVDIEV